MSVQGAIAVAVPFIVNIFDLIRGVLGCEGKFDWQGFFLLCRAWKGLGVFVGVDQGHLLDRSFKLSEGHMLVSNKGSEQ